MKVKNIIMEDFVNYKKPSMFIICPKCSFKCNIEAGSTVCQNSDIVLLPDIELSNDYIVNQYLSNDISKAIVFGGLEPFDTFGDMLSLIRQLRKYTDDDIVIYTGYDKNEIDSYITMLSLYKNVIVKFGRYIPSKVDPHIDPILGIELCSTNQYAEVISRC